MATRCCCTAPRRSTSRARGREDERRMSDVQAIVAVARGSTRHACSVVGRASRHPWASVPPSAVVPVPARRLPLCTVSTAVEPHALATSPRAIARLPLANQRSGQAPCSASAGVCPPRLGGHPLHLRQTVLQQ